MFPNFEGYHIVFQSRKTGKKEREILQKSEFTSVNTELTLR